MIKFNLPLTHGHNDLVIRTAAAALERDGVQYANNKLRMIIHGQAPAKSTSKRRQAIIDGMIANLK